MPRGDKSSYTDKQKRQAEHIEEGYEDRGVSQGEAEHRAWATVNKMTGGGKKSGSGRGEPVNKAPARTGGRIGGSIAAASRRIGTGQSSSRSSTPGRSSVQRRAATGSGKKR
jgi:plasmid stabilization system protein ParE